MKYVVVFDTPSIKQYVFGTDVLREIRGASANLDGLNRSDMERTLRAKLGESCKTERVYANGGAAQFIVMGAGEAELRKACDDVVARIAEKTAGDVRAVYGIAEWRDEQSDSYSGAVERAHFEVRARREFGAHVPCAVTAPLIAECASASHLPASRIVSIRGDEPRALSESSVFKDRRGRDAKERGVWAEWMTALAGYGPWPDEEGWDTLRCDSIADIGEAAQTLSGYVGLVYADGNAMGQIVQQLDSPEVYRAFSETVDDSIREACFRSLAEICAGEIEKIRHGKSQSLPADILLLGGDDLLVAVPADRSLQFARSAARHFQELTAERIQNYKEDEIREFFSRRRISRMSISCGVAVAKASYPFYLLLDLAEELLKNAKRADAPFQADEAGPARIDFHVVAGANSFSLGQTRRDDYAVADGPQTDGRRCIRRTLRPLTLDQIDRLQQSVQLLRDVNFPRSKLHALHEAALGGTDAQAQRMIRDILGRCKSSKDRNERLALWKAIETLRPNGTSFDFPTFVLGDERVLAVADIVEAMELLAWTSDSLSQEIQRDAPAT